MVLPTAPGANTGESRPHTAASQATTRQDDLDQDDNNGLITSGLIQQHLSAIRPIRSHSKADNKSEMQYAYTALDLSGQNIATLGATATATAAATATANTDATDSPDAKTAISNADTKSESPLAMYAQTLQSLNLSNNDLTSTDELTQFTQLSHLSLAWNSIAALSLPSSVCQTLVLLQLDHNDFDAVLPLSGATEFQSLQALTLSYNHLTSIQSLDDNAAQKENSSQTASGENGVTAATKSTASPSANVNSLLPQLQLLDISYNTQLASLVGIQSLSHLTVLLVSHCQLERLEGIQTLHALTKLDARHNRLSNLTVELHRLAQCGTQLCNIALEGNDELMMNLDESKVRTIKDTLTNSNKLSSSSSAVSLVGETGANTSSAPQSDALLCEVVSVLPHLTSLDSRSINASDRRLADAYKKNQEKLQAEAAAEAEAAQQAVQDAEARLARDAELQAERDAQQQQRELDEAALDEAALHKADGDASSSLNASAASHLKLQSQGDDESQDTGDESAISGAESAAEESAAEEDAQAAPGDANASQQESQEQSETEESQQASEDDTK